jgi:hypothetical protein
MNYRYLQNRDSDRSSLLSLSEPATEQDVARRYTGSLSDNFYDTFVAGHGSHIVLYHWFAYRGVLVYCAVHGRTVVYLDLFARWIHPSD